jgi:hypothetical protein
MEPPLPLYNHLQPTDPFFSAGDHAVFEEPCDSDKAYDKRRQRVRDKFLALHQAIFPEMQHRGWDLHPHWHAPNIVSTWYIGRVGRISFMKLRYLRSRQDVKRLGNLMGVPAPLDHAETQYTKHPMLDVRVDGRFIAIELLVTEWAWWDAQNFKNKIEGHPAERARFISLLRDLGDDYMFGGWPDTRSPQLVTTAADLADKDKLLSWMAGFEPGVDWLRLGIWYMQDDEFRLTTGEIAAEVLLRFEQLYPVYEFLLWRPENDFRQRR